MIPVWEGALATVESCDDFGHILQHVTAIRTLSKKPSHVLHQHLKLVHLECGRNLARHLT